MQTRFRNLVLRIAEHWAAWARGDKWREDDQGVSTKTSRVRFASTNSFRNFLESVSSLPWAPDHRNEVQVVAAGETHTFGIVEDVPDWVAGRSERQRSNIQIRVNAPDVGNLIVGFSTDVRGQVEKPTCRPGAGDGGDRALREWVCRQLDSHTVPTTRRDWRIGRQVVDPIDAAADLAERHSRRLALRSSAFGAAGGLVTGILAQAVGAALKG